MIFFDWIKSIFGEWTEKDQLKEDLGYEVK